MRLFLDASISPAVAIALRAHGFDVVDQRDVLKASASDREVMAEAWLDRRVVIARDYDIGELVLRGFADAEGVIILAFDFESSAAEAQRLAEELAALGEKVRGHVHVLSPAGRRGRPFDPAG
jgi:predicted nuclease of predicted toxin-antitoxin system